METTFERMEALLGPEAVKKAAGLRVLLFGVGGVGSACAEALVRGGIGHITLVDPDVVNRSNLNRQIVSLESNLGMPKVEAMAARMHDINPNCEVKTQCIFYGADNADALDFSQYDYVADAIDTVSSKLLIIDRCREAGTPIICSMGTGGKLHPELLRLGDIYETEGCPLARVMRKELRRRGIRQLPVVFSPEERIRRPEAGTVIGTVSFVPPVAGYIMAGKIIRDLLEV